MPLMTWPDLLARPRPKASERIAYGSDPNQFGDLWRPEGPSLHPLVIMIHGGCWQAKVADLSIMDWAAEDLRQRGYVVWNIEYRRLGQPGGGYPGTYEDVNAAVDLALGQGETRMGADVHRTVVIGHSAGGHLALLQADRPQIKGVVGLGAIADLERDTETACGAEAVAKMIGPAPLGPGALESRLAQVSPAHRPVSVPVVLITGAEDPTVPPYVGRRFIEKLTAAHPGAAPDIVMETPPGGHAEEIAPGTEAWAAAVAAVERLAKPRQ